MQLKKIVITTLFLGAASFANAQQKKTTIKPSTKTNTKTTTATQGINQQNYGTVLEYLSDVMQCTHPQLEEINSRKDILKTWENCYANNEKSEKTVSFTQSLAIDLQRSNAINGCENATAPTVMGNEANFFNENYKALRETFMKIALIWNDMSRYNRSSNPLNKEAGQKLTQDWITLKNQYYTIRKDLVIHNNQLQDQLFVYAVAGSPHKVAYVNMHSDLSSIEAFENQYDNIDEMIKNKSKLSEDLVKIENTIKERMLYPTSHEVPSGYQNYYEAVSNYVARTKTLLADNFSTSKQKSDAVYSYNYAYKALFAAYNQAMN